LSIGTGSEGTISRKVNFGVAGIGQDDAAFCDSLQKELVKVLAVASVLRLI
jgi:hypothetical protein